MALSAGAPEVAVVPEVVGRSPAAAHVRRLIVLAARSRANVIVTGETGTGKEVVARALHRLSGPSPGPFVALNCALASAEAFDRELFGYRRGAFMGARWSRAGLLRASDGGVLFLDELECLCPADQAKLLRIFDDGEARPLGSDRSRRVSVRFLAATSRSIDLMLTNGEMREDLYFRLRGFEIRLPPLRERAEDIALLAEHFLDGTNHALTPRALRALRSLSWPGNIRQLRNVVLCALAAADDGVIEEKHLCLDAQDDRLGGRTTNAAASALATATAGAARLNLQALERETIVRALSAGRGNRGRAAKALGIHRATLRRKLRELGIPADGGRDLAKP